MPTIRKNTNIIFAKNEVTRERKTSKLSSTAREMFKNIGKRRMVKYIFTLPLTTHTLSKEESQELVKQHEEHAQNLSLLAQLSKERSFYLVSRQSNSGLGISIPQILLMFILLIFLNIHKLGIGLFLLIILLNKFKGSQILG